MILEDSSISVQRKPMTRAATTAGERRRDEILAGALRCFTRQGVRATTIEDIRGESGASVGSIYHHVGGKDEIIATLYSEAVSAYRNGIMAALGSVSDPQDAIRAAVEFHVGWIDAHRELARLMLHWDESELSEAGRLQLAKETRRFGREMGGWLHEAACSGAIRELSPELYGALFMGPLLEFGRLQVGAHISAPVDQRASPLAEAIWRSLAV
jgi:AcrR family transcriptional regulator